MEFPLLVEDPAGTFPLPATSDDSNVEANGDNLVLFVGCPLNWLDTGDVVYNVVKVEVCSTFDCTLNWLDTVGGVVYNVAKVELCGTFDIARGGMLPVHKATGGGLTKEGLV